MDRDRIARPRQREHDGAADAPRPASDEGSRLGNGIGSNGHGHECIGGETTRDRGRTEAGATNSKFESYGASS